MVSYSSTNGIITLILTLSTKVYLYHYLDTQLHNLQLYMYIEERDS